MDTFLARISRSCSNGCVPGDQILGKCVSTLQEMIHDRGYSITSCCHTLASLLHKIEGGKPVLVAESRDDRTVVYIDKDDKTGIKFVRSILEDKASSDSVVVLVSLEGVTPFCKKEITDTIRFNVFTIKELTFNITKHTFVPTHKKLSKEEESAVLEQYSALSTQLPLLLMNDPVRRYYNWEPDSVVEIRRNGFAHETTLYYRRVA